VGRRGDPCRLGQVNEAIRFLRSEPGLVMSCVTQRDHHEYFMMSILVDEGLAKTYLLRC